MIIRLILSVFLVFSCGILSAKEGSHSESSSESGLKSIKSESKKGNLNKKDQTSGEEKQSSKSSDLIGKNRKSQAQKDSKNSKPSLSQSAQTQSKPQTPDLTNVQHKIERMFKEFLNIISAHPSGSKEYKKAVSFVERTLYDEISFDSLKLLSELYLEKEDIKGHVRVIKALSVSYPKKAESFYLLGKAHKALSKTIEDEKEQEANRRKMLENYRKALKLDPKHNPTYEILLEELMILDEESQELKHTRESLNLVMDMLKHLKEKQYYILLCEAYFDNKFIRQTQKACVKSIKKNPNEPISMMTLALSLPDKKKREEKLIAISSKYPHSFKAQYKIGRYFKDSSPERAISALINANKIQPNHLKLNEMLSRLLLRNNREEQAYSYFLKTCLLSEGVFLTEFKNALGFLRREKKIELAIKYDKGVKECFKTIRERKKKEKQKNSA